MAAAAAVANGNWRQILGNDVHNLRQAELAYKRMLLTAHPNKGGNSNRFVALQKAYEKAQEVLPEAPPKPKPRKQKPDNTNVRVFLHALPGINRASIDALFGRYLARTRVALDRLAALNPGSVEDAKQQKVLLDKIAKLYVTILRQHEEWQRALAKNGSTSVAVPNWPIVVLQTASGPSQPRSRKPLTYRPAMAQANKNLQLFMNRAAKKYVALKKRQAPPRPIARLEFWRRPSLSRSTSMNSFYSASLSRSNSLNSFDLANFHNALENLKTNNNKKRRQNVKLLQAPPQSWWQGVKSRLSQVI